MAITKTIADRNSILLKPYVGQTVDTFTVEDIDGNDAIAITTAGAVTFAETVAITGLTTLAALTATGVVSLTNASVSMTALPTTDPSVTGRIFQCGDGSLRISL